jgi:hypothetical protein
MARQASMMSWLTPWSGGDLEAVVEEGEEVGG